MSELKNITPRKLLWLDLEMTGLNPRVDRILEVAAIVTDWDLTELDSFETGVQQGEDAWVALRANSFAAARPKETQELINIAKRGVPETAAEQSLLQLLDAQLEPGEVALLAGNSIHMDRQFIRQYWPGLENRLHYRMLDVSSWKVVMTAKYGLSFTKQEKHRALDDIRESIAELRYYLEYVDGRRAEHADA